MQEYRTATQSLVLLAQRDLADFWGSLNVEGSPVAVRDALLEFIPELVLAYGDAAALLGADWYDMLREESPSAASFRAVMARPVDSEQARASARWGLGPLFDGNPGDALTLLAGSTQRLVMQPFRDTVFESGTTDPRKRWFARVPSGATTCKFCVMLASRGFVYATAESAGESNDWHDKCDCMVVPGTGPSDYPDGYDLAEYKRLNYELSGIGRDLPTE